MHMITCIDVGIRNAMICDVALCENISLNIMIIEPHAAEVLLFYVSLTQMRVLNILL